MECQSGDGKKLTKVFDASQRKRSKKKRDGYEDTNSVATDESAVGVLQTSCRALSEKASLPEVSSAQASRMDDHIPKRDRDSSPSQAHSPADMRRSSRSRRRHHRSAKEDISLALKAGLVSTPRSVTPHQEGEIVAESIPQDQDSFIYAFLEEAIKKDKKRRRHSRRREEKRRSPEREDSAAQDRRDRDYDRDRQRHHHRHKSDVPSREFEKQPIAEPTVPAINQAVLFETFAKICAQISEKESLNNDLSSIMPRTQSHKSLRGEINTRKEECEVDRQPIKLNDRSTSRDTVAVKTRSQTNCSNRARSRERPPIDGYRYNQDKCGCCYDKDLPKYASKLDMSKSRTHHFEDERYRDYPPVHVVPTRSCIDPYKRPPDKDYRDYDREMRMRHYEDEKKKYCEQKTSRSFDLHREYHEDERCRRTARSDPKERKYVDREKRYEEMGKYYDERPLEFRERSNNHVTSRDPRWRRNFERFEKTSVTSRDDDRDRDRYSERERDSGLSVADGDTSTVSGRSNYLKVVKQQISEQREAMDKMMKLWKELMRCFKGISQTQGQDKSVRESAANVRESAAEQMRLWWECMRRYETVARDVGDTDARLMEEIKKQRSEMAEMANMWQECLQRYRDISNDFNNLKQQLVPPESPTRLPAPGLLCTDGEGAPPIHPYRMPSAYPPVPQPSVGGGGMVVGPSGVGGVASAVAAGAAGAGGGRYARVSSPLARGPPPPWWWGDVPREPRRRSSPDSRASRTSRDREKDRRHRHKDREESRYKEKSSKPSAARSEHRHRKR